MALFGTKKPEDAAAPSPASATRVTGAPSGASPVGIDHVITLMRSLPTDKHADVVVMVLKTTLESLNIHVVDIVADAAKRMAQIDGRVTQLETEIATLQQEINKRTDEIERMKAARDETAKVKEYLETEEAEVVSSKAT